MTVFKCYMKIIKKNVGMILMYFVIFAVISIAMFYVSTGDNANGKFTSSKLNTGIVDNDNSNVSEKLAEYLSKLHNADMLEYLCYETNNIATRIYTANQYGELSKVFVL